MQSMAFPSGRPKVVGCKHVLEEGAEIVSKTKGLCRICHKAALKARAGIKVTEPSLGLRCHPSGSVWVLMAFLVLY